MCSRLSLTSPDVAYCLHVCLYLFIFYVLNAHENFESRTPKNKLALLSQCFHVLILAIIAAANQTQNHGRNAYNLLQPPQLIPIMSQVQDLLRSLPKLSTPSLSPPLTTFTLFPKLPIELRRKIIRFAAHEPREVLLCWHEGFFLIPPASTTDQISTDESFSNDQFLYSPHLLRVPKRRASILRVVRMQLRGAHVGDPRMQFQSRENVCIYANSEVDDFRVLPSLGSCSLGGVALAPCNFTPKVLEMIKILNT